MALKVPTPLRYDYSVCCVPHFLKKNNNNNNHNADNTIRVWDIKTGRERYALDGHANGVRTVRFDSKKIGTHLKDASVILQ